MWGWIQSPVLRLYRVSWRCSESGGEGCYVGGSRLAPAMPIPVPPAGKTSLRPHMMGPLWMPGACNALVKPAVLCQNGSWTSYP